MTNPAPEAAPEGLNHWQSLRYYLFQPWWRGVWFVGAIVWGVVFNWLFIVVEPREELFGVISIVPIFAFIIEQQGRARKLRQEKAKLEKF